MQVYVEIAKGHVELDNDRRTAEHGDTHALRLWVRQDLRRKNKKGTRNGMIVREQPQVQKLRMYVGTKTVNDCCRHHWVEHSAGKKLSTHTAARYCQSGERGNIKSSIRSGRRTDERSESVCQNIAGQVHTAR